MKILHRARREPGGALPVQESLNLLRGEFGERHPPQLGRYVVRHQESVAAERGRPHGRRNRVFEPPVEEGHHRLPLRRDVEALLLVAQRLGQLRLDFGSGGPLETLAVALAALPTQVDRPAPTAVLALVDRAFVLSSSAWRRQVAHRVQSEPTACSVHHSTRSGRTGSETR